MNGGESGTPEAVALAGLAELEAVARKASLRAFAVTVPLLALSLGLTVYLALSLVQQETAEAVVGLGMLVTMDCLIILMMLSSASPKLPHITDEGIAKRTVLLDRLVRRRRKVIEFGSILQAAWWSAGSTPKEHAGIMIVYNKPESARDFLRGNRGVYFLIEGQSIWSLERVLDVLRSKGVEVTREDRVGYLWGFRRNSQVRR